MAFEQAKLDKHGSPSSSEKFDATKNIRLVPKFQETEVDKYFLHFEKTAESLKWPKESWTLLLQSFTGKAGEIYPSLSIEQCHSYDVVKKAVLKARPMSWRPRLIGKDFEVQRKKPTKLMLSLQECKSKC